MAPILALPNPESFEEFLARTGLSADDESIDRYVFECMTGGRQDF